MNSDCNVGRVVLLAMSAVGDVSLVGRVSSVGGISFKSTPLREQSASLVCDLNRDTPKPRFIVTLMLVQYVTDIGFLQKVTPLLREMRPVTQKIGLLVGRNLFP
jgi:hypothetical protein